MVQLSDGGEALPICSPGLTSSVNKSFPGCELNRRLRFRFQRGEERPDGCAFWETPPVFGVDGSKLSTRVSKLSALAAVS